ncbi:hypothetical protein O3P69_013772 [Scylla paramamosain]|uniref:Single domain-containing protein n=1 Tax=Scylla paramamosain TaxID=85552 RepID=A0AAW0SQH2_SCYPA
MGHAVGIFLSCLLVLLAHQCEAAIINEEVTVNPKYPNACWVQEEMKAYKVGETWQMSKTCGRSTCIQGDGALFVQHNTCGVIAVGPGCQRVENKREADYPDCCPSLKCS